jgi:hypothetical protein
VVVEVEQAFAESASVMADRSAEAWSLPGGVQVFWVKVQAHGPEF